MANHTQSTKENSTKLSMIWVADYGKSKMKRQPNTFEILIQTQVTLIIVCKNQLNI